jgi:glycosyltransferase involved in cell wall biosynthesis
MPVRNEDWCLGLSLSAALEWCDQVIVADNGSTDCSRRIVEDLAEARPHRIVVRDDRETEWREMEQRQMLLEEAREHGATHIAIVDADEVLTGNLLHQIRPMVEALKPGHILNLPLYNLRGSIMRYHSNGPWSNRTVPVVFADSPELHWAGDHFHHREPKGRYLTPWHPLAQNEGGVFHLWGVSERRLRAKHALYKLTERLRWPDKDPQTINAYYNLAIRPQESWTFENVPAEWWAPYSDLLPMLDVNQTPWQEDQCRQILSMHDPSLFEGLDLFGVI